MLGLEVEVAARQQGGPCNWSDLHGQGEGREGRQPSYALQWGAAPYNLSLQRECKDDFGSEIVSIKHKKKYDVYDNISEDFAPFKLSDRISQNLKDLDGE